MFRYPLLLDLEAPTTVIARSDKPLIQPEAGILNVVQIFYGAADTSMACAELSLQDILDSLTAV